ncbi:hypothetical protein RhiirC2_716542 [Rhizophagus irregularis]|uniref:Uncharacterized protein n=1 Tax=Rhizophagus irregularis TaxID=588596 RepID=A0A2N1MQZ2_9GLOM|nr:hypothetical protein RhiirC2_716542 [Rhizophagus irregularis]
MLIWDQQGSQVPEPFSDKEASLDSSGSLDYNKDAKKDVEIDISASNIKEQAHHPIIQLEGRNIDDLWNDYNNLTQEQFKTLTVKDFNLIIETFRKFLKEKERAKEFFREMESEGIKPNVLILDSLGINGLDAIQKLQDSNAFEKILWRVAQGDYYLNYMEKCDIPTRNTQSLKDLFKRIMIKILYTGINAFVESCIFILATYLRSEIAGSYPMSVM